MLTDKLINAVTAVEMYASGQTFKEIFCFDTDRALDIFYYMQKYRLMQTMYVKMSKHEKEAFRLFFNEVAEKGTYDNMCTYIQDFTNQSKAI
jgi:hypothetical protein